MVHLDRVQHKKGGDQELTPVGRQTRGTPPQTDAHHSTLAPVRQK